MRSDQVRVLVRRSREVDVLVPSPMSARVITPRTLVLATLALVGFAGNSLLCRAAIGAGRIDPTSFTAWRFCSGAVVLLLLVRPRREVFAKGLGPALTLIAYAVTFSFAYLRLTTGTGALLLFGGAQVTMIGWGLFRGERPRVVEWIGIALATAGLVALVLPGLRAPDPMGAVLMIVSGFAWGVYSLLGRGAQRSMEVTARNFVLTGPVFALLLLVIPGRHSSMLGVGLAVFSGTITSALAYSAWYSALPSMTATQGSIAQLLVPILASLGGVIVLGEEVTLRLVISGVVVLGGIVLALPRPAAPRVASSRS
jgi:drug/metabolite transporter (DMT)-like permease